MSSIANLIYSATANKPDFAKSFIQGANAGMNRSLVNEQLQTSQAARQKQSALQALIAQGATPEQLARGGHLEAASQYAKVNEGQNKTKNEFWKEERSAATQDVRAFNKEAKDMLSDYNSLNNNASLAKSGDRGARNAMTVSVGRLMSPGIFTETEATALSGGQTPWQAFVEVLSGKGAEGEKVLNNISKYVDPYGDSFNADGLLSIGQNIVLSRTEPLMETYKYSSERAKRSQMPENQYNTIFGNNPYVPVLGELLKRGSVDAGQPKPQAQPAPQQQKPSAPTVMKFDSQGNLIK